jgi:hypothetical protein
MVQCRGTNEKKTTKTMNYIIEDTETGCVLYGHALLQDIKQKGRTAQARIYQIPAEAWIAFLQVRYQHVAEVRAYLAAVENGGGINPQRGAFLAAIDDAVEIPEEEFRYALKLCKLDDDNEEGEAWKRDV